MQSTPSGSVTVVVLTGASSAIGNATARHLARQRYHLHIGAGRLNRRGHP